MKTGTYRLNEPSGHGFYYFRLYKEGEWYKYYWGNSDFSNKTSIQKCHVSQVIKDYLDRKNAKLITPIKQSYVV